MEESIKPRKMLWEKLNFLKIVNLDKVKIAFTKRRFYFPFPFFFSNQNSKVWFYFGGVRVCNCYLLMLLVWSLCLGRDDVKAVLTKLKDEGVMWGRKRWASQRHRRSNLPSQRRWYVYLSWGAWGGKNNTTFVAEAQDTEMKC